MACSDHSSYAEALTQGAIWDAITCVFIDTMGQLVFAVFFMFPIFMSLYFLTGSIAVPFAITVIAGAAFMMYLPGFAVSTVMFVLVIGLAIAAFIATMRIKRE